MEKDKLGRFSKKETKITILKDYAIVHGYNQDYKISLDKVDLVKQYTWSKDTFGYAKCQSIKMHRLVMNAKDGQKIDHINQDINDNRNENLRFVSHSLNIRNSNKTKAKSGIKHIQCNTKTFAVLLYCRGKRYYKGGFITIEDAINYRNELYNEIKYYEE